MIVTLNLPTPLPRDGGPRATQTGVRVQQVLAIDLDPAPILVVRVPFAAAYAATDEAIVDAALRTSTENLSEKNLRASTPSLFDGDDEGLILVGDSTVSFIAGDMTAISDVNSSWTLGTADGSLQIDTVKPEIPPTLR